METKTETKVEQINGVVNGANMERVASTQIQNWVTPEWNDERRKLARKMVTPPSANEVEFEFFIKWCERTGLDPFIRQAYLVERTAKVRDAKGGEYTVVKHEPMAAESGLAARADALPDFRGMQAAAVYEGDSFEVDEETGTVRHKWSLAERAKAGNKLLGAWAHAKRDGRTIPVTYLPLLSRMPVYKDGNPASPFWKGDKAAGQIVKCARAEQYRLAYPNVFGGLYIEEEMQREDVVEGEVAARSTPPAASRTQSVLDKVKAQVQGAPAANAEPPVERIEVGPPVPTPPPANTTPSGATTAAPVEPIVEFGAKKGLPQGKRIVDLTGPELEQCIAEYEKHLADPRTKGTPTASKMFLNLDALKSELAQRMAVVEDAPF